MKRYGRIFQVALFLVAVAPETLAQTSPPYSPQSRTDLAQASPAPGAPGVTKGWNCSNCTLGSTYCVINLVRYEHVCAPLKSYACAGFSGTSYCAFGTVCLDGQCLNLW